MAARENRPGRDRNLWVEDGFEDMSSHSSGQPPQDFFAEFARNHAASQARRSGASPGERPRLSLIHI